IANMVQHHRERRKLLEDEPDPWQTFDVRAFREVDTDWHAQVCSALQQVRAVEPVERTVAIWSADAQSAGAALDALGQSRGSIRLAPVDGAHGDKSVRMLAGCVH